MVAEHKFRVWYQCANCLQYKARRFSLVDGYGNCTDPGASYSCETGGWCDFHIHSSPEVSMSQLTLDGGFIFEGDIVTMHQFFFEGVEVEKIIGGILKMGDYGWELTQIRNKYVEEYCGFDAGEGALPLNNFFGVHEESFEVIGNHVENPEMLRGF